MSRTWVDDSYTIQREARRMAQAKAEVAAALAQRPCATDDEARTMADQIFGQVFTSPRSWVKVLVWIGAATIVVAAVVWVFERQNVAADTLPVTGTIASATPSHSCDKTGCKDHYTVSYQVGGRSYTMRFDDYADVWQVREGVPLLVNPDDPGTSPVRAGTSHNTSTIVVGVGGLVCVLVLLPLVSTLNSRRHFRRHALMCIAALRQRQGAGDVSG